MISSIRLAAFVDWVVTAQAATDRTANTARIASNRQGLLVADKTFFKDADPLIRPVADTPDRTRELTAAVRNIRGNAANGPGDPYSASVALLPRAPACSLALWPNQLPLSAS